MSCTNASMLVPVAASDFATDSVDGQRARPSGVMRFDLLKVVGSSPAFLARPDAERPARAASRSRAFQIWAWVSIEVPLKEVRIKRTFIRYIGIIAPMKGRPATFTGRTATYNAAESRPAVRGADDLRVVD